MGIVLGWLGQQELVQPFQRVVSGAASDAGEVVNFPAHATYSACLFDDAGLFHGTQKLHPFHRQNFRENTFP
ncbi:hypothetical protein D3C84_1110050 [compost metagenome]